MINRKQERRHGKAVGSEK